MILLIEKNIKNWNTANIDYVEVVGKCNSHK
jgi:hypothetical protein